MMKIKLYCILTIALISQLTVGNALATCSLTDINTLLGSLAAASEIKDDEALADLISTSYYQTFVNIEPTSPVPISMDYQDYLDWQIATSSNTFSDYYFFNTEVLETVSSTRTLVGTETYTSTTYGEAKFHELITVVEESSECLILNRILVRYEYNYF